MRRLLPWAILVAVGYIGNASCGGNDSPIEPTPVCSITVSPASGAFGSEGGTGAATVTVAAGCAWTATSSASWIVITGGSSGSGPGTVTYAVNANTDTQSRNGALTIGGQSHAITQQGRPATVCTYDISPDSSTLGSDGGNRTFTVSAPADCAWTAVSSEPWVVVTSGQGSGNGTVSYAVAPNTDTVERAATISVADRKFTVRQGGNVAACQYSVGPVDFSPCMPGGSVSATLTTQASCPWTASPDASWISLPEGTTRTGSGVITISYGDNYDAPRQGTVKVRWDTPTAGQNIRVAQAGCLYSVSPSDFAFGFGGGTGRFDVYQISDPNTCGGPLQDRCVWTAQSDVSWITITGSMPRSGDNPVAFTVAPNGGTTSRVGHVIVRDKVVTITQSR